MFGLTTLAFLFVFWAFLFQVLLIIHFALRRWAFARYIEKYGWLFYAMSIPAVIVSVILAAGGMAWSFWLGGFLFLVWGAFGYGVEYRRGIRWRDPIRWPIFGPYVFLYLATSMFYWWPLGLIGSSLWYTYGVLFVISTTLNGLSHRGPQAPGEMG